MPSSSRRQFLQSTLASAALAAASPSLFAQSQPNKKIGYALVGLGQLNIHQILPAFAHTSNSKPTALVSGHPDKAQALAKQYNIPESSIYTYETYDKLKDNPEVDAVYIALPNSMHAEYTIRAAAAGKHVFCEKPMANTPEDCQKMIDACKKADRKLMIGYRMRYEPHTTAAIDLIKSGSLGKAKLIQSVHSFNIAPNQWRLDKKLSGGGPLVDIGIYCLNACRYLTGEEPAEITAQNYQPKDDERFKEVEESTVFTLKFPSGCLATCSTSYAHLYEGRATVYCEKGTVDLNPAFPYQGVRLKVRSKDNKAAYDQIPDVDQFAQELEHFSKCIIENKTPQTPGEEGLKDVTLIQAIYQAAQQAKTIHV
jgi:predicted dehydrogenase